MSGIWGTLPFTVWTLGKHTKWSHFDSRYWGRGRYWASPEKWEPSTGLESTPPHGLEKVSSLKWDETLNAGAMWSMIQNLDFKKSVKRGSVKQVLDGAPEICSVFSGVFSWMRIYEQGWVWMEQALSHNMPKCVGCIYRWTKQRFVVVSLWQELPHPAKRYLWKSHK